MFVNKYFCYMKYKRMIDIFVCLFVCLFFQQRFREETCKYFCRDSLVQKTFSGRFIILNVTNISKQKYLNFNPLIGSRIPNRTIEQRLIVCCDYMIHSIGRLPRLNCCCCRFQSIQNLKNTIQHDNITTKYNRYN